MTNSVGRAASLVAAIAVGLALAFTGTAAAAPGPPGNCTIGTAKGKGTSTTDGRPLAFDFTVCERGPAATDTSGQYTARSDVGPPSQGRVLCADLNDHTMAFLYALDGTSGPAGQQVLVVISDGGPKPADDRIGFLGPMPAQDFKNGCGLGTKQAQTVTQTWQPLSGGGITVALTRM